jgi:divalent metal cation (Fe/Co/Zn/Cd) transporter
MNEKERAALDSIAALAGLMAAKAIIGLLTGSLAILSEAQAFAASNVAVGLVQDQKLN